MRALTDWSHKHRAWLPLALLLSARLSLGLAYSLVVPPWESFDEDGHFEYARYLARYRRLLQPGDPEADRVWEKFQPPLYYALIAPFIAGYDLGETFESPEPNPYFATGLAGVNYALHPDPLAGQARQLASALQVARAVGVVLSTLSVVFVYLTARRVWPAAPLAAWAATSLYAFWPQFLFVGSMVTNDVLVTVLASVAFYFCVVIALDGVTVWRGLMLGVVLGSGLLAKLNAIALLPVAMLAVIIGVAGGKSRAIHWRSPRLWLAMLGAGLIIILALRALGSLEFVTGQVFQAETFSRFLFHAPAAGQGRSQIVVSSLRYGFRTFLASFGWGNVETYPWLYGGWAAGAGLALIGIAMQSFGSKRAVPGGILGLVFAQIISLVLLALALAIAQQDVHLVPGRYLLPMLPAVSVGLVGGWAALAPVSLRSFIWKAVGAGLPLIGCSIPLFTLARVYARPQPLSASAAVDFSLSVQFGEAIELLGYQRPGPVIPGEDFRISLCWQALAPIEHNYSVFVEMVGPDGQGYGRLETYPGRGNYATSFWRPRTPFCDAYAFNIGRDIPAPSVAHVRVSLLEGVHGPSLAIENPNGGGAEHEVRIPVRVQATGPFPAPAQAATFRFGDGIVLRGYDIEPLSGGRPGVLVRLHWEARQDIHEDYVVFVHLRDTPDHAYSQGDGQPRSGWYPTSWWRAGDVVLDEHTLVFPGPAAAPPLDLYVGLFDLHTGERLVALDTQGLPLTNDEIVLAQSLVFR